MKKRFYKLNNIWYIDLPEFLEQGLGTLANLMMVDGADTFLDHISKNGSEVWVTFSNQHFLGAKYSLVAEKFGKNQSLLSFLGHAPVQYGRYYTVPEFNNHRLWLCPVTEYVFGGAYPDVIWLGLNN
jgi:hypothetical protein